MEDDFYYRIEPETEILTLGKKIVIIKSGSEENQRVLVYDGEELLLPGDKGMWVYSYEGSTSVFNDNTGESVHFDSDGTITGWENVNEIFKYIICKTRNTKRGKENESDKTYL